MGSGDDFAALMEGAGAAPQLALSRYRPGDTVRGTVIQIGADTVFLDVGGPLDAQMERAEFVDRSGQLTVALGDEVSATVVHSGEGSLKLARTLGRTATDTSQLEQALESGLALEGTVVRAVKAGLEIDIGGVRAFCPASQVERTYTQDLEAYVGQPFRCRVIEMKEDGRSVIVSRKALLAAEADAERDDALARLEVGQDLEGTVQSLQKYGAFVDLGGVQGLVHISELSPNRVERVEDVVRVGERVTVRVLRIRRDGAQTRVELSMKALAQPAAAAVVPDTVLDGTVVKVVGSGVVVDTEQGSGLVPLRELGLHRGADHRRAFPEGKAVRVVLLARDPSGKLSLSIRRVAAVEERQNFAVYGKGEAAGSKSGAGLGSLGALLVEKLGLEPPQAPEPEPTRAPEPEASWTAPETKTPASASPADSPPVAAPEPPPASAVQPDRSHVDRAPAPQTGRRDLPEGIVRRRRK